ncbi:MAG: SIS domain-containing protein, partial [Candidatus Rokuibacteriota bacterium]
MTHQPVDKASFAREYFAGLKAVMDRVDLGQVAAFVAELERAYRDDHQIFIIGNGGSAGTASHMACDLAKTVLGRRPDPGRRRFRVMSLTDNVPLITAIGNDLGYDHVFTEQLAVFARRGDLLVAITGSGNSPNVVNAVRMAREMGLRTTGMLGFDGGEVLSMLDTPLLIPDFSYGFVEDLHMVLDHLVTAYFTR